MWWYGPEDFYWLYEWPDGTLVNEAWVEVDADGNELVYDEDVIWIKTWVTEDMVTVVAGDWQASYPLNADVPLIDADVPLIDEEWDEWIIYDSYA